MNVCADKIGIVVQNVLTTDKHAHHYATSEGLVGLQGSSKNKDIYVV